MSVPTTRRDLNKNGRMDPYEDPCRPIEERVGDLLGRMTIEEKAGLLFHAMAPLDVLFGRARPEGKLPFQLPSSMAAVERQHPDAPHDSEDPLVPFGHGLSY